jgi:hypothetical protein
LVDSRPLESRWLSVEVDKNTGAWALTDARSGVRWPTEGIASAGAVAALSDGFAETEDVRHNWQSPGSGL